MGTAIPPNHASFELEELVHCARGTVRHGGDHPRIVGVGTDTRRLRPNNAFVALSGERFDGHDHVSSAVDAGASVLIVSREVDGTGECAVIQVEDTLVALGRLGQAHRRKWAEACRGAGLAPRVVGITGSAGKTTTCRAVTSALEAMGRTGVHYTAGNLNNAIGIPLVLLGLGPEHDTAVVELGTNQPGEIAYASGLVEPDVGVLTLVACAHTQRLGTLEAVAREKGEIFATLPPTGTCVANADDPLVMAQLERASGTRIVTFGKSEHADVRVTGTDGRGWEGQQVRMIARSGGRGIPVEVSVPLLGAAGVYASSAAVAVAMAVGGPHADVGAAAAGLSRMRAEQGRLRPRQLAQGSVLIDDAYNANPASMRDSIDVAATLAADLGRPLTLVLGEMRELGAQSEAEHRRVGAQVAQAGAARVLAVGGDARIVAEVAKGAGIVAEFCPDAEDAIERLREMVGEADMVLVKGSRGVALERVVAALEICGREGHS